MGQSSPLAAPQRGILFLQASFVVMLLDSVFGGALHVYPMQLLKQRDGFLHGMFSASLIFAALQLVDFAASLLMIFGLERLARAPQAARMTRLAQTTMILIGLAVVLRITLYQLPRLLAANLEISEMRPILLAVSFAQLAINLAALILLSEGVLRLRRHAAPGPATTNGEALWRGGIFGLLTARFVLGGLSQTLAGVLATFGLPFEWGMYVVREPCSVALYVALLYLLRSTEKLLLDVPPVLGPRDA